MPTRGDSGEERFVRLEQLMEEYRINHEALETYVRKVRDEARERHQQSPKRR